MKKLEMFFAVLKRKKFDRLPFAADIMWWYRFHKERGTLPGEYKHMDHIEVAKATGLIAQVDTGFYKIETENVERVKRRETVYNRRELVKKSVCTTVFKTPVGKLRSKAVQKPSSMHELFEWTTEFPVKNVDDMRVMKYVLDHSRAEPAFEEYVTRQKNYGDDGLALPVLPHSPFQRILLDIMGPKNGFIALYRHRKEVEDLMLSIERLDDDIFQLAERLPSKIFEWGEHVHSDINNPKIFSKYQIPYFRKRIAQLHARGKICYCHWDGYFRDLLPLLKDTGFDAIEGITPKPAGDVTLAELRDAAEGKVVLWGGIPASIFCDPYSDQYFEKYVLDTLKTVAPGDGFVMGLGDNLGPTGYIHRVRLINDLLEKYGYYPISL